MCAKRSDAGGGPAQQLLGELVGDDFGLGEAPPGRHPPHDPTEVPKHAITEDVLATLPATDVEVMVAIDLDVQVPAVRREQRFEDFIAAHNTFTAQQIRFLRTLETFVLDKGHVEKKNLIEAPFTQVHPKGIRGVFQPQEIEEILEFTAGLAA